MADYHGVQDLVAMVATSHKQFSQTSFPVSDLVVARVTGQGSLRVLGQRRVLRGRVAMNPAQAWIAPHTRQIAFTYATGRDGLDRGLAVINDDGTYLRVLAKPTFSVIWHLGWDASGTRLLAVDWQDPQTYILTFNTNRVHSAAHRAYTTRKALFDAAFVGSSSSTFLLQVAGDSRNFVELERHRHVSHLVSSNGAIDGIAVSPSGASFAYSRHLRPGGPWALQTATFAHPHRARTVVKGDGTDTLQYSPGSERIFYSVERDEGVHSAYSIRWVWTAGGTEEKVDLPSRYASYQLAGIVNAQ